MEGVKKLLLVWAVEIEPKQVNNQYVTNILLKKAFSSNFFIILRHINQQNHFKMKKLSIVAALLFAFGTVAFAQDKATTTTTTDKKATTEKKSDGKKTEKKSDKKTEKKTTTTAPADKK